MNILVTGSGSSGSWAIRGEQLGRAIGAKVVPMATPADVSWADVVILVKRPIQQVVDAARKLRKPIVYDVVDAYPQPHGNTWERDDCMRWLSVALKAVSPAFVIGATEAMSSDIASLGWRTHHLYHHGRPGIQINPIRERLRVFGYEGGGQYFGQWSSMIAIYCSKHAATLRVCDGRESVIHEFDVALGLRDFHGYAAKHWKSNVKLANAQASGTPFIGCGERGYTETSSGAEYFVSDYASFCTAAEWLKEQSGRKSASEKMLAKAYSLEQCAKDYRRILSAV